MKPSSDHQRYVGACDYPGTLDEQAVEHNLRTYLSALGINRRIVRLRSGWTLAEHPNLRQYAELVLDAIRPYLSGIADSAARDARAALEAFAAREARAALEARDARAALDAFAAREARDARAALDAFAAREARAALEARDARAALDAFAAREARDASEGRDDTLTASLTRFVQWCIQRNYYWAVSELSWAVTTWLGAKTNTVKAWSGPLFEAFISGAWILHWTESTLYWVAKPVVHVERPTRTIRRLHNSTGPAVESDLENLYFWHGVLVPAFVVVRPDWITLGHIRDEENAEVRRIMTERFGAQRYLKEAGSKLLDMDSLTLVGSAPRALVEDDTGNKWLIGTDGSTKRVYTMAVPTHVRTCREAHESICGFDESKIIAEC